jgi:N-acetylglucosamine-6-sulfatase
MKNCRVANPINGSIFALALTFFSSALAATEEGEKSLEVTWSETPAISTPTNVIYILTDDQRFDEMGFMNPIIDTPNIDRLASEGVHFENAFVTTALCSPSRATILTGQYMHNHGVVDNNSPRNPNSVLFSEYLQIAGYDTAFIGKWHMGEAASASRNLDDPQPGFNHWVSFAGQGHYYPTRLRNGEMNKFNINGEHVLQKGYITDELTDYALDYLSNRESDKPFFLYLSHKAVHANFSPAKRHASLYSDREIPIPLSQADTAENYRGKPMWVKNQRNSWHGVDFPYHSSLDVQAYKMEYHRAMSAVDDSIGRILSWLEANGLEKNTIVMLMGDNGFLFGEHGLIDKRNAYEESMRVPLVAWGPGVIEQGHTVDEMVANLDIAPTMLDIAGLESPEQFEGRSLLGLARGRPVSNWRDELLYEYYWEFNFPSTPTTFALRTDDYKLIQYHGIWDTEELYDMQNDPNEMRNLIGDPRYLPIVASMRQQLFKRLENNRGQHVVPYTEKFSSGAVFRERDRSKAAEFPARWLKKDTDKGLEDFFVPDYRRVEARKKAAEKKASQPD